VSDLNSGQGSAFLDGTGKLTETFDLRITVNSELLGFTLAAQVNKAIFNNEQAGLGTS
jgi:hypothetical protein